MTVSIRLILFNFFIVTCLLQELLASSSVCLEEKLSVKRRIELINKHAIKSFTTKNGEILDCVQINKQLAFDHPLLKNHSIQMKPSTDVLKRGKPEYHSPLEELKLSQLQPMNMICPHGTVMVKRVTQEDLAFEKMISLTLGNSNLASTNSNIVRTNNARQQLGLQSAYAVTTTKNMGVGGQINTWGFYVKPEQYSIGFIAAASDDGPNTNVIHAGWIISPWLNNINVTRSFAFWTIDGGRKTGCFNAICPGFVQVHRKYTLGMVIDKVSTYNDPVQFMLSTQLIQDVKTRNWLLYFAHEYIGYWPKELFTSLVDGASRAAWGGHVYSPKKGLAPAMGSGHFANEGFAKSCFIVNMDLFGVNQFPSYDQIKCVMTKSDCYSVQYNGDIGGSFRHTTFFGGPPNII